MTIKLPLLILCCLFFFLVRPASSQQQLDAVRIVGAPKVDGKGDDEVWKKVPAAFSGAFTQLAPDNLEPSAYKTELKVAYNDYAFFVIARMYDPKPATIPRELGLRDQWGKNTDRFAFILDTYQNGQNAFYFGVTAAGVQLDSYMLPQYEDRAWDAVWKSAVTFDDEGWIAEFEIPYSAIRFSKASVQNWGINFIRKVQRDNEDSSWNPVDNKISGFVNQAGALRGLHDVEPPLRLQLFPYLSSNFNHAGESGEGNASFGGGMDVKLGLNESFTLDMSLIPDFSQVQSDNLVLNLSPFEVRYNENRPFFTEGTDLFNKGGLFYSRRVGGVFGTFDAEAQMKEGERVVLRPADAQLLNAAKISGRTNSGLGIGFFNAVTDNTYLEIEDSLTSEKRKVLIDPLTNFNVLVLDQNLKNNSNIGLINTNVTRLQGGRDANVTGMDFRLNDKSNTYRIEGFGAFNLIAPSRNAADRSPVHGYKYYLRAGKVSGNFQFGLSRNVESDKYDINDIGFLKAANEIIYSLNTGYYIFKPFWIFNRINYSVGLNYRQLYQPREFTNFSLSNNVWMQFRNFWSLGGWYGVNPVDSYDFFEARRDGYYFTRRSSFNSGVSLSSDGRKRLSVYGQFGIFRRNAWDLHQYNFSLRPRLRLSDKLSLSHRINASHRRNDRGFVREDGEADEGPVIFGNREIRNMENISNLNFIFTNRMGLSLRLRHYWSRVAYDRYFELMKDGSLKDSPYTGVNDEGELEHQLNFNAFNMDLVYNWQFGPGSFITVSWKNAFQDTHHDVGMNFGENINTFSSVPQNNSFSLKITYFLDYLMMKQMFEPAMPQEPGRQWKNDSPSARL